MASNYSAYNSQHNHSPQYVYYAPALARHPNTHTHTHTHTPSYYYAPAVPVQALPPGQLHPRSRSFNDLYAGYYPQQALGPPPAASPNLSLSSAPAAIPPIAASASVDHHLNAHARSVSNVAATPPISIAQAPGSPQPANPQPASSQSASSQSASSGSKPLRYRGRMARSKSHSSLLAPNTPTNTNIPPGAPDAPAGIPAPAAQSAAQSAAHSAAQSVAQSVALSPSGTHGRRLSSTSSLHRHKNYSASMSSNDGSSTPSIMSTADTDSLTTQTSVSSTSSLDEETKSQKLSQTRRRSMANTLVENTDVPVENVKEFETEAKNPKLPTGSVSKPIDDEIHRVGESNVLEVLPKTEAESSKEAQKKPMQEAAASTEPAAPEIFVMDAATPPKEHATEESTTSKFRPEVTTGANSEAAKPAASASSDLFAAQKASLSRTPAKHNNLQASEASQAREASIKPARDAKEALPSKASSTTNAKEVVSKEEQSFKEQSFKEQSPKEQSPKEQSPKEQSPKEQSPKEPSPKNRSSSESDEGSSPNSNAPAVLTRPKRATAASPSKLVLPSDLQPRSYYQSTAGSESRDSLAATRHTRSASWYTGTSPSSGSSNAADDTSEPHLAASAASPRPRTPSSHSDSSTASNPVFLRRSYASRQRPSVQSMPPRRPESVLGGAQAVSHHPLPRAPSSSSSVERRVSSNSSLTERRDSSTSSFVDRREPSTSSSSSMERRAAQRPASVTIPRPNSVMSNTGSPTESSPPTHKVRHSRSFGSRLKSMFSKEKLGQSADDVSDTASIVSTRSTKSSASVRSSTSSFSSLSSRFRRKRSSVVENIEPPAPPAPAMTRSTLRGPASPIPPISPLSKPMLRTPSATPSPTSPEAPRPPSPSLSSIGRQVAPNLTAGDIYPGLLRPNEVDTIISSLERTGSFERKLSTSRRSKEEKVPDERVIRAPEPAASSDTTHKPPLKSAMKSSGGARTVLSRGGRRISFAKNTLVYNTYSASDYNRTPEPLPYDFRDPRVVTQLYRELNDVKLSMQVHPSSKHHTVYVFNPEERYLRALQS